jgi:hypothetical protein
MLIQQFPGLALPALGRETIRLAKDRWVVVRHADIAADDDLYKPGMID